LPSQPFAKGSSKLVFRTMWQGTDVAVLRFGNLSTLLGSSPNSQDIKCNDEYLNSFLREVQILGMLDHPNIVKLLAYCIDPSSLCIIQHYFPLGALDKILYDKTENNKKLYKLSNELKANMIFDIAKGMEYIHSCSVIHRDLKPSNCMVVSLSLSDRVTIKISDFQNIRSWLTYTALQ